MEKLLTRTEAAKVLGVSKTTLDQIRSNGDIEYIQYCPNGKVWLTPSSIEKYQKKFTFKTVPESSGETFRKKRK